MLNIDNIQDIFLLKQSHTVILDKYGVVLETNDHLFTLKPNSKIQDFHPFFAVGFVELLDTPDVQENFYCVHIDTEERKGIYDIFFNSGNNQLPPFLIFTDNTAQYSFFQNIAQEKNESILNYRAEEAQNLILQREKEFKNKFLANVSHDLRTPIASMIGFVEILEQSILSREQKDILKTIFQTAHHLSGLVEDLIDLSRIESGQFLFKNKSFDFYDFIDQIEKTYLVKTAAKNLDLKINFDSRIPKFIIADRTRLFQLITNIMDNALKFTERGTINLDINQNYRRADNVGIQIMLTDTGIGFENHSSNKPFDSFTKFHSEDFGGLGLGLSIVQEIVLQLNGTIKIKSAIQAGTTIEINIPLKINMEVSAKAKKIVLKEFLATDFIKKYKVLVVDDNETNQLLLLKMLSDHGGFFIDITDTCNQALQVIETEQYDLIILDVNMPIMTGIECVPYIKNNINPKIAKTPIIILSANPTVEERRTVKKIGVKDYIPRPHTRETLFLSIYKSLKIKKNFS